MLFVKNTGTEPSSFVAVIFYRDEKYMIGAVKIEPGKTVAIDVRKLRDQQVPDAFGKLLPLDLESGQFQWLRIAGPKMVGRMRILSRSKRISMNMSCAWCLCGPVDVTFNQKEASVSALVGDSVQQQVFRTDWSCTGQANTYPFPEPPGSMSWDSTDHFVASPNSTGRVTCWSPGFAWILAGAWVIVEYQEPGECESGPCEDVCNTDEFFRDSEAFYDVSAPPPPPPPTVSVTTADIVADQIVVSLSPASSSGTLVVTAQGPSVSKTVFSGTRSGGQHTFSFGRASLPIGSYTTVTASWLGASASRSVSFHALGVYRHSQYNVPAESACSGSPITAWVISGACVFTQTTLRSDFAQQVFINGTGSSISHGLLKYTTSCSNYPPGASSQNSFLKVTSVTGSCNTPLIAGQDVAVYPNPALGTSYPTWVCGDDLLYVTAAGANQASKNVADYCPGCATDFFGTSGHIDDFSSGAVCSGRALGDYGNYMTIRLRASP